MAKAQNGNMYYSFLPAVSRAALKAMGAQVRRWRRHRQTGATLAELARWMNPIIRGWMNYYGRFRRSALYPPSNASTPTWCVGREGNSPDYGPTSDSEPGGSGSSPTIPTASPTGNG